MSYFDDQIEAWFGGGREWYAKENNIPLKQLGIIPGDFDPYVFWGEAEDAP